MKTLLVTEILTDKPNEGTLVFVMHLARFLARHGNCIVAYSKGEPPTDIESYRVISRKTLYSVGLSRLLGREKFNAIVYVPQSGLTAFGLARAALLRSVSRIPTIAIGLQYRSIGNLHTLLVKFWKPNLVLSPTSSLREKLRKLGVRSNFIMPGYDDRLFRPVDEGKRTQLRSKYGLPHDRFIVLHVGHLRESRNLESFLRYRDWGIDVQPVIKAGEVDKSWANRLRMAGIIVIDEYIDAVHEIYQASDCYFFPVDECMGAVEFPLSVIEACACNIPVITTRFGILPKMLREGNGLWYFERVSEVGRLMEQARREACSTSLKVRDFSWEMVFRQYLLPHLGELRVQSHLEDKR